MTSQLIIWMGTDPSGPWYWTGQEGARTGASDAVPMAEQGRADDAAQKAELMALNYKDICVIIAGQSVRIIAHDLPKLSSKEQISAAGFMIEEHIAASLGEQHIVLGHKTDARIAIIAKSMMQDIISAIDAAGLNDVAIYADFDALSSANENLAVGDRVIVAKPLGHTLDKSWHDPKETATIVEDAKALSKFVNVDTAINLRQNDFAPRKSFAFSGMQISLKSLGRVAALCLLCGVSWLGFQATSARAKGQEAAFIKAETLKIYTQATGQSSPNPALAATRAIQAGPVKEAGFLTLSKVLFEAAAQTDGIIIETVQYDKSRSELSLRIIYPGFASTTDLEVAADKFGGVFEAGGVREQGGQFIGDATLRLGDGS